MKGAIKESKGLLTLAQAAGSARAAEEGESGPAEVRRWLCVLLPLTPEGARARGYLGTWVPGWVPGNLRLLPPQPSTARLLAVVCVVLAAQEHLGVWVLRCLPPSLLPFLCTPP